MFDVLPLISDTQFSVLDRMAMSRIHSHSISSNPCTYICNAPPPISSQMRSLESAMPGDVKNVNFQALTPDLINQKVGLKGLF